MTETRAQIKAAQEALDPKLDALREYDSAVHWVKLTSDKLDEARDQFNQAVAQLRQAEQKLRKLQIEP